MEDRKAREGPKAPAAAAPKEEPKRRSNPFGDAKPVQVKEKADLKVKLSHYFGVFCWLLLEICDSLQASLGRVTIHTIHTTRTTLATKKA